MSAFNASAKHQEFLKQFEEALDEQQDLGPELRQRLLAQFDDALTQAESNPTDVALTLANWKETVANLSGLLSGSGEKSLSATDTSDLFRTFDGVTQQLEGLQKAHASQAGEAGETANSAPLPQGMPADLAAKLGRH